MLNLTNWNDIVKKEARGTNDYDLGEVQSVDADTVITQRGMADKDRFHIPKNLASRFDGDTIYFTISETDAKQYKKE